ncbi:hypothetical protein SDC9_189861 [bioreactor metagenome]|uniref:Uncharacterized protein n=1 Tax=bioreactor metagenome TaxID=1076179 RepID=A0A645I1H5_9ZZZZ
MKTIPAEQKNQVNENRQSEYPDKHPRFRPVGINMIDGWNVADGTGGPVPFQFFFAVLGQCLGKKHPPGKFLRSEIFGVMHIGASASIHLFQSPDIIYHEKIKSKYKTS